jgi:electron transport complex protein RnfE
VSQPTDYKAIVSNGLWQSNPALVQILGMCPLLAVSSTVINALGLGLATMLTLTLTNAAVSAMRHYVRPEIRIPLFVMTIACVVTAVELAMNAYLHDLYKILGIFIPLIVTNCIVIARAESFASKNSLGSSMLDGAMMGLGFTAVLVVLGAIREILGRGTLLADAHLMFGEGARWLTVTVFPEYEGFLLALLPPGAFMALALLIALKNVIDARRSQRREAVPTAVAIAQPGHGAHAG